jgi:uncharacterized small protein (TIGR04563 family)
VDHCRSNGARRAIFLTKPHAAAVTTRHTPYPLEPATRGTTDHYEEAILANDKDSISNLRTESSKTDKRKQSLYFPESMLQEIKEEAARLDRSLSWVVQRAWKISRLEIKKLPSVNEVEGGDDDDDT